MMTAWKASPAVILLMAALVIIGIVIVVATSSPTLREEETRVANLPPSTTAIPQATTSITVMTTVPPSSTTPYPTEIVVVLPSVVVDTTLLPPPPTPDPTVQARGLLHRYIGDKLYEEPATLVAQGTNTTPVPSELYTGLSLITYEVREVTLPEAKTWEDWVPGTQGGLELRPVTFTQSWRVTVKGTGFIIGNSMWVIFADDRMIGYAGPVKEGLTTIIYDRTLLREGERLGVARYGSSIVYLPEVLQLPPSP